MKHILNFIIIVIIPCAGLFAQNIDLKHQLFLNENTLIAQSQPDVSVSAENVVSKPMVTKNKGKAFFMSFILPGLGEKYAGSNTKAQYFFATEITLWLTYSGLITFREWRKDEYKTFAASHAQVDLSNKNDSYFVDLGNYNSIYEYNEAKLRDRNLPEYYYDVEGMYWEWENPTFRHDFEQLRISADRADNRATFVVGAILANHVISAIDAVWSVYKHNNKVNESQSSLNMDVRVGSLNSSTTLSLNLSKNL